MPKLAVGLQPHFYHDAIDEITLYSRALASNGIATCSNAGADTNMLCLPSRAPAIVTQPLSQR